MTASGGPVTSPLAAVPGAVLGEPPDHGVSAHYGDPFAEQRALTSGVGLVDRSNREVLAVTGPDRLSWLHSLTSQHLAALPPWRSTQALVLSPHGHVEHHLLVHDDGAAAWLEVEPGTATALAEWLERMRFLLQVEVTVSDRSVLTLAGPGTNDVLGALGLPVPAAAEVVAAGLATVRRRDWPGLAVDLLAAPTALAELAAGALAAGARPAGLWAFEALRVHERVPRMGYETDHRTIPHEVGWLEAAVHLDKGCYRGQETVARVHNLGRPPRRLVLLQLDGSDAELPPRESPVLRDGVRVGFVTTSARHFEDGPVALALVKRAVPDEAVLTAGSVPAAIDVEPASSG